MTYMHPCPPLAMPLPTSNSDSDPNFNSKFVLLSSYFKLKQW